MGRPTKLSLTVQSTLVFALSEGATIDHACAYAGIHPDTYYAWMKRGEAGEPDFAEFAESVTRARGQGVVTDLLTISHAVRAGDWKAAAWRLGHRYPAEYGQKLKISGDAEHPLTVLQALPPDQLDARIRALLAQTGYAEQGVGTREVGSRGDTPSDPTSPTPTSLLPSPEEPV